MFRKTVFWLHLSAGVTAGVFILIMAATGVLLSFERQIVEFVDRDIEYVSVPQDPRSGSLSDLLKAVRWADLGEPSAIIVRNHPQAAIQFSLRRGKSVYVDPYSSAVLGVSSPKIHEFFSAVERLHRSLGAPLASRGVGHWLTAISNLVFGALILLGVILWLPRKWMVIVLTGVVMSFGWANALLFRLTGSTASAAGREGGERRPNGGDKSVMGHEPNYDHMFNVAKTLNPNWRTITLNIARDANAPVSATIDTGTGGQPQNRTQYLLNRDTGRVIKITSFADGSLGQRLRAFVRFGHTGEYGGLPGQVIAAMASLGACVLVYTGLLLAMRRLGARLKRKRPRIVTSREAHEEQPAVT